MALLYVFTFLSGDRAAMTEARYAASSYHSPTDDGVSPHVGISSSAAAAEDAAAAAGGGGGGGGFLGPPRGATSGEDFASAFAVAFGCGRFFAVGGVSGGTGTTGG